MYFLGIADLGINLPVLIAQFVNFTIVLIFLRLVVYKPILRLLDERSRRIREGLEAAEQSKEQAAEANQEVQAQIEAARREAQGIVANAQQVASRIQDDARQRAQTENESMLERARAEIQLERDGAIARLREEFADLTIAAAERVIGQSLDRSAHQRLIDQVLTDSSFREN
jgi:F-type H+-transporting ATPase subunit b